MELNMDMKIEQVLEVYDHDVNQSYFLIEKDGEWVKISKKEYEKIRGKK